MAKKLTPLDICKSVLEEFLLNSPVPICSSNSKDYLDEYVRDYLIERGRTEFLVKDVSYGYQVGGLSEAALLSFAQSEKVFKGKKGEFRIKLVYGIHSVRLFEAWPSSDTYFKHQKNKSL